MEQQGCGWSRNRKYALAVRIAEEVCGSIDSGAFLAAGVVLEHLAGAEIATSVPGAHPAVEGGSTSNRIFSKFQYLDRAQNHVFADTSPGLYGFCENV